MKIRLKDPSTDHLNTLLEVSGQEVELEGVYGGVGIPTDQGYIGVCQRDAGVEVLLDGEMVFASYEDAGRLEKLYLAVKDLRDEVGPRVPDMVSFDTEKLRNTLDQILDIIPGRIKAAHEPIDPQTGGVQPDGS